MNDQAKTPGDRTFRPVVAKRNLRALLILQLFRRQTGRLLLTFLALAVLFAAIAIVQHWFVHAQLYRTVRAELRSWAGLVTREIAYKDGWNLKGYRSASIEAPAWYVFSEDGLIIDIEGFIPGLFGNISPPDKSIYGAPKTIQTAVGETWRVFGRHVLGGVVVLAINAPKREADADAILATNAEKFGTTLQEATALRSREIDAEVDFAVISSNGELQAASGGTPLKTDLRVLPKASDRMVPLVSEREPYLLFFSPILDRTGEEVGVVIVPKEMGLQQEALKAQDTFNFIIVGIAALVACGIALWLVLHQYLIQTKNITLDEAMKFGESLTIEFKSTFQWDLRRGKYIEERRLDILKSIAGFLNSRGGTLFIGVTEDTDPPTLRGLDEDLRHVGGSKDRLQRTLRDLITARIGAEFSPLITDTLEEKTGHLYWTVSVQESPKPAFVRWKSAGESKEQRKFYVREGPKTSDLDNESTWHYIKNKWR